MQSYAQFLIFLTLVAITTIKAAEYRRTGSDGRQYYFNTDPVNWYKAMHKCGQLNMQLVEINSQQKNNIVLSLLRSIFSKPVNMWLGANDEYNEAKDFKRPFYWSSSGERMTYSFWSKNNPDNYRSREHCVQIWKSESTHTWNDNQCTAQMGYICEEHYLTTKYHKEMQQKRQVTKGKNEQLSKDFSKTENEIKNINMNTRKSTEEFYKISQKSTDDTLEAFQISFMAIIRSKPYMEAVITDVKDDINKLTLDTQKKLKEISQETQENVESTQLNAEKVINNLNADFGKKLNVNKNEIDALLA